MTECDECGFVYQDIEPRGVSGALGSLGPRLHDALTGADRADLARRPDPATWSALEYACHLRDVLLVQRERVLRALVEDAPRFEPMHREERVELAGYASEPPALVVQELEVAARMLARLLGRLTDDQRARRCVYNWPAPTEVDVLWVGRHTVHEGEHHLGDIRRVLRLVARR